jgi:FKBP-type peptidyl-prolyl cis-trans isomerase
MRSEPQQQLNKPGKADMAELNRYMVRKDRERIESYIERKGLPMHETGTGLWYYITVDGEGEYLSDFDNVEMEYDCSLLDGTICYSSVKDGIKNIILGRSEIEPGLYQGLKMLKSGGQAVFIIPPFLAYGLKGDGKNIPSRAILVYNIKITSVIKSNVN